jgi:intracellular sulfur oxidation DsrE/DsrF family protein
MKKTVYLILMLMFPASLFAQKLPPQLQGKMTYPVFDFNPWTGVAKSNFSALGYQSDAACKVVLDVSMSVKDSTKINMGLVDAARTYNLHVANGVPQVKMDVAIVIHGEAVPAVLNDQAYQSMYGVNNPNLEAIKEMSEAGVKFYICSQNLVMHKLTQHDLAPNIAVALSAKTALTMLEQMGYAYLRIADS